MILSTKQQFVDCLSLDENSRYIAKYNDLTLTSVFQAIYDGADQVIGVEALVRIHHDQFGPIRPDRFFHRHDFTQEDKLNVERLSRVIHIRNFCRSEYRHLLIFLNVLPSAGETFALGNINSMLLSQRLKALNIDNSQVVMEVVEFDANNEDRLTKAIQNLAECEFKIAVDDFGMNASTSERVMRLQPNIIKLDRSLLLSYMKGSHEPLKIGLELAKKIGAQVVVEGIETGQQLSTMRALGVDFYQGYYLGLPQPLNTVYDDEFGLHDNLGDPSVVYRQA
ncbi:EAL domain-containing protein [Vibrio sp. M260118]|uniref:EAL domain-containing protein n=1 Tax=Vibrio sp. M260118 TaxID=3020896 RepID=UPI002F41F00B